VIKIDIFLMNSNDAGNDAPRKRVQSSWIAYDIIFVIL